MTRPKPKPRSTPPRPKSSIEWLNENIDRIIEEVESEGPTTLTLREWRAYQWSQDQADEPRETRDAFGR